MEINEEESSFEWEMSLFPLQDQTNGKLAPHKKLFDAGQNFMDRFDQWMHTQVGIHEPSVIETEIVEVLRIITELETVFAEKPETLKLTIDVRRNFLKGLNNNYKKPLPFRSRQLWMSLRPTCPSFKHWEIVECGIVTGNKSRR